MKSGLFIRRSKKAIPTLRFFVRFMSNIRFGFMFFACLLNIFQSSLTYAASTTAACDSAFYGENDVLYYNECLCTTTPQAISGTLPNKPTDGKYKAGSGINKHLFIIVHTTEGDSAAGAEQALLSKGYSYHALIDQSGAEIRLLPDDVNAIGAGGANTNSLQVALVGKVGADGGSHFDPQSAQLQTLSKQIGEWATKYNIPVEKVSFTTQDDTHGVIGHIDVHAAASEGHTDPGANFPWAQVLANAKGSGGSAVAASSGSAAVSSNPASSSSSSSLCCPSGSSTGSGGGGSGSFDGSSGGGGGCGDKTGSQANKDQVWSFLKSKGLSDNAAAGIMGNIQGESGFNPSIANGGGCIGIVQWCDRAGAEKDFAAQKGTSWDCLGTQLEYVWKELDNSSYSDLKDALKGDYSPGQMAMFFRSAYERPGYSGPGGATLPFSMIKDGSYKNLSKSQLGEYYGYDDNADKNYQAYTGKSATPLGSASSSAACSTSSNPEKNL
ncbi:MAG: phage tail tape measure protein [Candidatus Saccharibacteria bacterium]|nr:phage tail tape measure protein [Candidatus Saccharibacteria bacterium]